MNGKGLSVWATGFAFAGCFLGVGCMSGQEVWQFFGSFGLSGFVGMLFAVAGLAIFNLLLVRIVTATGDARIDHAVVGSGNRLLLGLTGALEIVVFFGTYVVTASGAGALFETLTGFRGAHYVGAFVFCLVLSFLAIKGIRGVVKLFSYAVPLLVFLAFAASVLTVWQNKEALLQPTVEVVHHPFIPNAPLGALTFTSYNFFCSIGVLCPVGLQVKSRRAALGGTVFGSLLLLTEMVAVVFALKVSPQAATAELPMLEVAYALSEGFGGLYALLLFLSMTGASLACLVPTVTYAAEHLRAAEKHGALTVFLISAAAFVLSCFGFADLVGMVFSALGYVSLLPLVGISVTALRRGKFRR